MISKILKVSPHNELDRLHELQYAVDQFALTAIIQDTGFLVDANERFLQVLGFAHEEVFKTPFSKLLVRPMQEVFSNQVLPIVQRGITWRGELSFRARNNCQLWTEAIIVPFLNKLTNLLCFHVIGFEVTERKAVEKALANSSIFSSKLMELAPIGIFLADADGQCTYINKMWSDLSDCRLRKALGMEWIRAIHPADQIAVRESWSRLVHDNELFHCEFRYKHGSGKNVWVESIAERVRFTDDTEDHFIRVENDLSERKESEKVILEQQAQMFTTFKMSALGEMAGGIAHEINNPLAILQLRAKQITLLTKSPVDDPTMLIAAAESIHQTTTRIASIVKALRAISRDGSNDPMILTPIESLIADTLELCSSRFAHHDIALRVKPFPESLEIRCRPTEILQILVNLLNNAFSAVENLKERWVEIEVHVAADAIEIFVTDSGLGIPPSLRERIFQPFVTTKPVGSGTGLGLSICKGLALGHSGTLCLEEDSPHTRFALRLPQEEPLISQRNELGA